MKEIALIVLVLFTLRFIRTVYRQRTVSSHMDRVKSLLRLLGSLETKWDKAGYYIAVVLHGLLTLAVICMAYWGIVNM